MKRIFLLLIVLLSVTFAHAHKASIKTALHKVADTNTKKVFNKKPSSYLGFSSGINNSAGVLGLDFNIPLSRVVTLDAGVGPSTWGNKLFIGSKYYLKSPQRGFAFGGGFTFSSGQENRTARLETVNGRQRVTLTLKPQMNFFAGAYHYWTLGKRNNRFYSGLGWSAPIIERGRFTQVIGPPLTERGKRMEKFRCPGGLVLCFGFSFAIYRR